MPWLRLCRPGQESLQWLIIAPVFLGCFFVAIAFGFAALARAEVAAAARSAAREAAIECGQGTSSWSADARQVAIDQLEQGALPLGPEVANPTKAGDWYVGTYCSSPGQPGGIAAVQVEYVVLDLFPQWGALDGGTGNPGAWRLDQVASFPTE